MTTPPQTPSPAERHTYRLLVSARKHGAKRYVWEIVRDNELRSVVQRSAEAFATMEEAHSFGSTALAQFLRSS
jgi:hypothetical protein